MLKLSIIIPVYNTKKYLSECLDSVINQTYTHLEIICVNDGSTDNSLSILEEYAKKDPRILVISKLNGGQSSARNAGLDKMTGDLVTFVDSDDVVQLDSYAKNIAVFQKDNDVEIVQYPLIFEWPLKSERLLKPESSMLIGKNEIFKSTWKNDRFIYSVCNKIFKKEIFHKLRFKDNTLFEDMLLTAQYGKKIQQVFISEEGCYYYRGREGSTMISKPSFKKDKDYSFAQLEFYKESLSNPLIPKNESLLYLLERILWVVNYNFENYNFNERKEIIKILKPYKPKFSSIVDLLFDSSVSNTNKLHLFFLSSIGIKNTYNLYAFYAKLKHS
ncbi:MAG: glycosyltransferase [Candidatus Symbiothrix sp.]|jgi:glycosyltransferase involved in cell wall biosynthesis|nr:glycosyltransferase [Candidatus Symbiothrix sp.]